MRRLRNYIAGSFSETSATLENVNPATGEVVGLVPDSDAADVDRAAQAARAAFPAWSKTPVAERARLLEALAGKIEQHTEELARLEVEDSGKPLTRARTLEIPRAASNFRFFATAVQNFHAETYRTDGVGLNYTLNQPRGVAGCISPWNLPLYLFTWKIAPALAAGCTVVAKPSELTPTTAERLCEFAQEIGLPPGVLNVVHGLGAKAGAAIVAHRGINTISFTGGTVTGAEVARVAAPLFKKVGLELGGKNPTLVFADADLAEAMPACVQAAFGNQGQICLCGSRILVEESIYETFVEQFVAIARNLVVGDPLDPATQQGSLISKAHWDKVRGHVDRAVAEGGKLLCGGTVPSLPQRCKNGYFLSPTVIAGLDPKCRTNQEEIFGPVATLMPFRGEREALAIANGVDYGLSASLFTTNLGRAHRLAEALECGTVWVNCWLVRDLRVPFGGVKSSGVGREGGDHALRFFTDPKTVCIRYSDEVPA
jgi:aminomuconate-semialdehyde/2-hydroxymuconate-6-semialdehyde dehydrogenase